MDDQSLETRLSQISTQWTQLFAAHSDPQPAGQVLLAQLVQRYCRAVYRYLLAAVRDPDVAADLAQEFALRFLRGDFKGANPERGRFRSYVKTVLHHLVADYYRDRKAAGRPLVEDVADPQQAQTDHLEEDVEFVQSWRETILQRTWQALENFNAGYYAALKLRVESPEMNSGEMAQQISRQLGKPMNAAAVRKAVQRGHEKFADLLLDEVAATLENSSANDVEEELRELDLLRYCKSALPRRRQREAMSSDG
jgi:RNA polymerase sigma-70 factor (ECF subfamily)